MGRLNPSVDFDDLAQCDLVIEAVFEDVNVKHEVLREVEAELKPSAIFASNTSTIPIAQIATASQRPERVIGMHFFNPVPVMQLVELIRGLQTSDTTYAAVEAVAKKIGKIPVKVLAYTATGALMAGWCW